METEALLNEKISVQQARQEFANYANNIPEPMMVSVAPPKANPSVSSKTKQQQHFKPGKATKDKATTKCCTIS
ncbi:Guanine nucleotide-binding protein subunit gamma [Schizosaccharomyces pombe]|uniref:Guanine nucleotide-binding protein subunit gamma n=1 Tax=Schizosaccharomyces pombe (strain 972 / ATCC 24843) TaxID=284812 RepID=GBG_SCHPO|nr:heterotrimeric G protein gamma subunit Git11 [Schizosaccharomyces pombe]O94309.1 RecName: Full=Guanine nucleotide-binding protein subunit gamma; Flags: Precursor [Schizosaccharomyces pombe 972h-]CAA22118.1 heterotrimeric G protein gamma subunit Git11 [Schizosaccharomyces pombe]|eukprot:NP_596681.1 heterotrimeric G protein gamma subunit Git11 [Schizosaccharomyces pombe]